MHNTIDTDGLCVSNTTQRQTNLVERDQWFVVKRGNQIVSKKFGTMAEAQMESYRILQESPGVVNIVAVDNAGKELLRG